MMLSAISGMFFTGYSVISQSVSAAGHAVNAAAAYFLYKGIIVLGFKRPFDIMNNDLNEADYKIKEYEKIIFKNEEYCEFIINNSSDAILVVCNDRLVFANNKIVKMLGAKAPEDIIGLEVCRIVPEEVRKESLKRISSVLKDRKGVPFTESKMLRFDGQMVDVEVTNNYFSYRGKPAVIAMFRDIGLQKQIMRLENDMALEKEIADKTTKLNKMLTEFFSNISHELKTPLNVILGAIQVLQMPFDGYSNNCTEVNQVKYLKTMKQNCFRLLRLVNNLIDLSKFDSGYYKLSLKNYNIVNVVEEITLSVVDYIEQKGIELIFDTDVEEKTMAVDADKVEKISIEFLDIYS